MHGLFSRMWWLLLFVAAVGCESDDMSEDRHPMVIEALIDEPNELVRTVMTGDKEVFAAGDKIGVFETLTGISNAQCTYNGTSWAFSTPNYWRNGTSMHTFYAYYPYKSVKMETKVSAPILATQTVSTVPDATANLIVAGPHNQIRSAGVPLSFRHAYALIQLNVKMGLVNLFTLNSITINGGNSSAGLSPYGIFNKVGGGSNVGYDLVAKKLYINGNTSANLSQSVKFNITGITLTTSAVTIYAFVLPGTYTNPVPSISFSVALLGTGVVSISGTTNFPNTTFEAGKKYIYNVTINRLLRTPTLHTTLELCKIAPCEYRMPSSI